MLLDLLAVALSAVAAFAQWRVARFTASPSRAWITRAILAALGVAVGLVMLRNAGSASGIAWFFIGLGLVHVPPALVLLLKGLRGEQPS